MERLAAQALEPSSDRAPAFSPSNAGPRPCTVERPRSTVLLGIPVELAPPPEILRTVLAWNDDEPPHRVMYINAHVVNQTHRLPELQRALCNADLVYCEDHGVRLAARAFDLPVPHRMTGVDWVCGLAALCDLSARSLYLLGADPPRAHEAAARLVRWYPRLRIAGAHHGYADMDSPQNQRVIDDINTKRPDIVLVGMGTPKQQLWADRYASQLDVSVVWTVGSLLDDIAGHGHGLEWIWRTAIEPCRRWRRYAIANPVFLSRVLAEARRRRATSA